VIVATWLCVVGREIELGPAALGGWVDGEFGRWQGEDQRAVASIHRPGPEDLGQVARVASASSL